MVRLGERQHPNRTTMFTYHDTLNPRPKRLLCASKNDACLIANLNIINILISILKIFMLLMHCCNVLDRLFQMAWALVIPPSVHVHRYMLLLQAPHERIVMQFMIRI